MIKEDTIVQKQKLDRWQYIFAGLIAAIATILITRTLIDRESERLLYEIVWFIVFTVFYIVAIYGQVMWKRRRKSTH